jgi:hypothetical protein
MDEVPNLILWYLLAYASIYTNIHLKCCVIYLILFIPLFIGLRFYLYLFLSCTMVHIIIYSHSTHVSKNITVYLFQFIPWIIVHSHLFICIHPIILWFPSWLYFIPFMYNDISSNEFTSIPCIMDKFTYMYFYSYHTLWHIPIHLFLVITMHEDRFPYIYFNNSSSYNVLLVNSQLFIPSHTMYYDTLPFIHLHSLYHRRTPSLSFQIIWSWLHVSWLCLTPLIS